MKFRNIPKNVQHRVKTYYEQRYRRNYFDEGMILGSVSDVLRNEMQMHNCHHLVEKVSLFKSLPMSFLTRIVANLKFEVNRMHNFDSSVLILSINIINFYNLS